MEEDLKSLNTEQVNENTIHIDEMDTLGMVHAINREDKLVALAVEAVLPQTARLIDMIHERMMKGGRVFYIGAGTSGRLGVLDASECPPTYGVDSTLIQGVIAGGYPALLKAKEGAEDSRELAVEDLKAQNLNETDTVIGLAASGRTPYVIGGLIYAKETGALTSAISCVEHAAISAYADVAIEAVTGPEAITGSTRMKAGTAQKMILNIISTSLMIQYGKVYQNLMVDVQPTNEKLVERAKRIIAAAGSCSLTEAEGYLKDSGKNVKVAICMSISGSSRQQCEECLEKNAGNISKTIRQLKNS